MCSTLQGIFVEEVLVGDFVTERRNKAHLSDSATILSVDQVSTATMHVTAVKDSSSITQVHSKMLFR